MGAYPARPTPKSNNGAIVAVALFGIFILFVGVRILRARSAASDYQKAADAREAEEKAAAKQIDDIAENGKKKTKGLADAIDTCVKRESSTVTDAIKVAQSKGLANTPYKQPKKDDKDRLVSAGAWTFPTKDDPNPTPTKATVVTSSWVSAAGTKCPVDKKQAITDYEALLTQKPSTYSSTLKKDIDAWQGKIDDAAKLLPKMKEIDSTEPPNVVAVVKDDCTGNAVDFFTDNYGGKLEVFAYSCRTYIAWVSVPDGAILGGLAGSGYASPSRRLDDYVNTSEISSLNSETEAAADKKAADAMQKTLTAWGG
jgi:hypothetical protein